MMNDAAEVYEVHEGVLFVNGRPLPLGRGLVTLALVKAGWRGIEGLLPLDLVRKALFLDPRLGVLARLSLAAPRSLAG